MSPVVRLCQGSSRSPTTICSHAALARAQRAHPRHCHWLAQQASQNRFKHHRKQNGTHKCPVDASSSNGIGTVFPLREDIVLADCGTRQQSSKEKLDVSSLLLVNVFVDQLWLPKSCRFPNSPPDHGTIADFVLQRLLWSISLVLLHFTSCKGKFWTSTAGDLDDPSCVSLSLPLCALSSTISCGIWRYPCPVNCMSASALRRRFVPGAFINLSGDLGQPSSIWIPAMTLLHPCLKLSTSLNPGHLRI